MSFVQVDGGALGVGEGQSLGEFLIEVRDVGEERVLVVIDEAFLVRAVKPFSILLRQPSCRMLFTKTATLFLSGERHKERSMTAYSQERKEVVCHRVVGPDAVLIEWPKVRVLGRVH